MTDLAQTWLTEQPAAITLLAAYAERESQLPKRTTRAETAGAQEPTVPAESAVEESLPAVNEEENADAWIPRIVTIEGVDAAALSTLHGGLIASGFLKFEIFGRQMGMRYRLTPDGRRAAESGLVAAAG